MEKLWHTLKSEDALNDLETCVSGLSQEEAGARLARFGENKLADAKKHGLLYKFLVQFKNVMVIILLAAALITTVVAIVEKQPQEFIDVGIILAIVVINAVIGVAQESKAEQALSALKNMSKPYAKVRRDGEIIKIESEKLVSGDIVILEAGDIVPADVRLTITASLKVEESALTGEPMSVEKSANDIFLQNAPLGDRKNMAFSGSVVTYGRGEGVVVATGMQAEVGKIAQMLGETDSAPTPIQKKLNATGKVISIAVIIIAVIIFAAGILSSLHLGNIADHIVQAFMTAVAIAVAAIPEGLTAVITIIMAFGVQKMSKKRAIIRHLPAVETLGSTEIICSDKTGTLTLNKMTVKKLYTLNINISESERASGRDYDELVRCMTLCNDTIASDEDGVFKTTGDPTETALVQYAKSRGFDKREMEKQFPRTDEIPFDSDRKLMTTVNGGTCYTKGAPDMLLVRCKFVLDGEKVRAMTETDRNRIAKANHEMAAKALRVLAYAMNDGKTARDDMENDLTFIGLSGMIDPPREEVKDAVKVCKKAGMRAVMITGDHRDTAYAIALELGIADNESQVVTGSRLSEMTDEELFENVENYRVYARVSPEHKVRIVKAWKRKGKVVAMTGDGVNDAPSIKAADIGIGMGITGTDVTKGAADMVLADDNFATIVVAVEEGRKIFANMQKTIQFLLSANVAEVLALFIATMIFIGRDFTFLTPTQILWVNLITDCLPALALGMENAEKGIMDVPPRKSSSNLFAGRVGINIVYQGLIQTMQVLGVFLISYYIWTPAIATTLAFLTLCFVQLFHCFNVKSINGTIFHKSLFQNKLMWLSFAAGIVLTMLVILVPPIASVFGLVSGLSLGLNQWLLAIGASFAIIPLVELVKLIERLVVKHRAR